MTNVLAPIDANTFDFEPVMKELRTGNCALINKILLDLQFTDKDILKSGELCMYCYDLLTQEEKDKVIPIYNSNTKDVEGKPIIYCYYSFKRN